MYSVGVSSVPAAMVSRCSISCGVRRSAVRISAISERHAEHQCTVTTNSGDRTPNAADDVPVSRQHQPQPADDHEDLGRLGAQHRATDAPALGVSPAPSDQRVGDRRRDRDAATQHRRPRAVAARPSAATSAHATLASACQHSTVRSAARRACEHLRARCGRAGRRCRRRWRRLRVAHCRALRMVNPGRANLWIIAYCAAPATNAARMRRCA